MNYFRSAAIILLAAIPTIAHAGTSTDTGTASLNVINQCSIAGSNVDFGTFTSNDTIADVTAVNGRWDIAGSGVVYTVGSRGIEYAEWGTVTCDNGVPYSITIQGTADNWAAPNGIEFVWQNQSGSTVGMVMDILVKKLGNETVPDSEPEYPGAGTIISRQPVAGVGTGTPQQIRGSAIYNFYGVSVKIPDASDVLSEKLVPGSYVAPLNYTLTF